MTRPPARLTQADSCLPHPPPRAVSMTLSVLSSPFWSSAPWETSSPCAWPVTGQEDQLKGVPLARPAVPDLLLTLALPRRVTCHVLDYSWPLGEGLCRLTVLLLSHLRGSASGRV